MLNHNHVMSSLRAFGLCTRLPATRLALNSRAVPPSRSVSSQCLRRGATRTAARWQRGIARSASTAARQARSPYRYPPDINIYRHGALATSFVGVTRLATLLIFGGGTFILFPIYTYAYFFPAETSSDKENPVQWYYPPLILLGSSLPAVLAFFAFAPWVHQIHVNLPTVARKSKEELMRWASNVPRNTTLMVSVIRFKPWPTVQYAPLEDLSRLPHSYTRLTNLEHMPPDHERYIADHKSPWRARLMEGMARRVYGRFYVSRTQGKDKSAVPGVWDKMWDQIPMEGERLERKVLLEQRKAQAKPPGPRILPPRPKT